MKKNKTHKKKGFAYFDGCITIKFDRILTLKEMEMIAKNPYQFLNKPKTKEE